MIKKVMQALMALALVVGVTASSIQPAEAGRGGRVAAGIAAGIIGLGLLGAYAHERDRHYRYAGECYPGPEECGWKNRRCFTNSWGDRVCRGGRWTCWRPTYCD
ncbi:hypothetical protein [Hyphomicrobium sp.]|uniref:hypothetical protein n=1 Tax=Hyphomicrobium sp. TaxID=82 RepID=UPI0025BEEFAF|nr:hypothetical protein [Hyphomicrobium sp.]MCC7253039.1 hypothetical protein [Hyphomicrobium sp.]